MNRIRMALLSCLLLTRAQSRCDAYAPFPVQSLGVLVEKSDVVVVARLDKYEFTPHAIDLHASDDGHGGKSVKGPDAEILVNNISSPGLYDFSVLKPLKGNIDGRLTLRLSVVLSNAFGGARLDIQHHHQFLLFLRRNGDGWTPTDWITPFYPVANQAAVPDTHPDGVLSQCQELLLASCSDPLLRQAVTFTFRHERGERLMRGLAPFLDDPNPRTRENVLTFMAYNKQVAPRN